jgi:hypothetical protein
MKKLGKIEDGFKKEFSKIMNFLNVLETPEGEVILTGLAELSRDILWKRVKAGYGVTSDESSSPTKDRLKELSKPYVKSRRKMVLGEFASPGRSNLTRTGQMLDSIITKIKKGGFILEIPNSSRTDSSISNKKVAEHVSENGRPFFALTDKEQLQIVRQYLNLIRQLSTKLFS